MDRKKFEEFKRRMAARGIPVREEKPPGDKAEIIVSPRRQFREWHGSRPVK